MVFCAFYRLAAIEVKLGEVGYGVELGQVFGGQGAGDFADVAFGLLAGGGKVFFGGFVFGKKYAFIEDVDELGVAVFVFYGVFKAGVFFAVHAEDGEKVVPEAVFFAAFIGGALPFGGKLLGGSELVF